MAQHSPHGRLLGKAAREVLGPLGLSQCGRSRVWIDDRRWHLIVVEFEASGFTRGSCLNVGVMWLWHSRDKIALDLGGRAEEFKEFRNKSQFDREALRLSRRAAELVAEYRGQITDVHAAAEFMLARRDQGGPWEQFHTAVACGLAGRAEHARTHFDRVTHAPPRVPAEARLHDEATRLRGDLNEPHLFRIAAEQCVLASRELLRLPPVASIDFGLAVPAGQA